MLEYCSPKAPPFGINSVCEVLFRFTDTLSVLIPRVEPPPRANGPDEVLFRFVGALSVLPRAKSVEKTVLFKMKR